MIATATSHHRAHLMRLYIDAREHSSAQSLAVLSDADYKVFDK